MSSLGSETVSSSGRILDTDRRAQMSNNMSGRTTGQLQAERDAIYIEYNVSPREWAWRPCSRTPTTRKQPQCFRFKSVEEEEGEECLGAVPRG